MKVVQEIDRNTLKCLLIAAHCVGWDSGRLGYNIDSPHIQREWDGLEELLNNPEKALTK